MVYLYDNAIAEDLEKSFQNTSSSAVKVVNPEGAVDIIGQIKEDNIEYPVVILERNPYSLDSSQINFTRLHSGVATVIDNETNDIYYEKQFPIVLSYNLTILTLNTVDMDELVRELVFKYTNMYFLTIQLPYESDRKIRFGVEIPYGTEIEVQSGAFEYISGGKLYQTMLPLRCQGCIEVSYTPAKLQHLDIPDVNPIRHKPTAEEVRNSLYKKSHNF